MRLTFGSSQDAPLLQADVAPGAEHEVVEHLDAHQRARRGQPPREREVLGRGLRVARGVVVEEDEGGRAGDDRLLEDLARVDEAGGQAADRDDGLATQPVPDVEGQEAECLDRARRVARQQVAGGLTRGLEGGRDGATVGGQPGAQLEGRQDAGGLRPAQAADLLQVGQGARSESVQARAQQLSGEVEGGEPAGTGAEERGQELTAGEGARPQQREALARPLVARQVLQVQ
jgi:hypothetical protein